MTQWWDADARRYRSSLGHKIVWCGIGELARKAMIRWMPPDQAHEWGIPLIWWGDKIARTIDAAIQWGLLIPAAALVCLLIRLLLLIPGFTFDTSEDDPT